MILDPDTIQLIKTMAFCRTEKMKSIKKKFNPFSDRASQFSVFLDELGLERIDEYIEKVIEIVIDTWTAWNATISRLNNQTSDILDIWPEWELIRFQSQSIERDWDKRWRDAAESVGWAGVRKGKRKIARKDSPIWYALGNGAGGYDDCWGLPYPPFAICSGMDWDQVEARTSRPIKNTPGARDIIEAIKRYGIPKI